MTSFRSACQQVVVCYKTVKQGDLIHHKGMRRVFEVTRKRYNYIYLHICGDRDAKSWKLGAFVFNTLGFTKAGERVA